jgi:2-C-methyl-D-erythritol 2,4-cyclodiphosphate synthase
MVAASTTTASTATDDLLSPSYDIEPIPTRIGHGFDIHRMAPLQEAGQPVVIGGVEITHKDQKVGAKNTMFILQKIKVLIFWMS